MVACHCWVGTSTFFHVRAIVQRCRVAVLSRNCSHLLISKHVASDGVRDVRATLKMCACCCCCAAADCTVESTRVAKSASPARSQSNVIIITVCVTLSHALPRNPVSEMFVERFAVDCSRQRVADVVRCWYLLDQETACCNHVLNPRVACLDMPLVAQALSARKRFRTWNCLTR